MKKGEEGRTHSKWGSKEGINILTGGERGDKSEGFPREEEQETGSELTKVRGVTTMGGGNIESRGRERSESFLSWGPLGVGEVVGEPRKEPPTSSPRGDLLGGLLLLDNVRGEGPVHPPPPRWRGVGVLDPTPGGRDASPNLPGLSTPSSRVTKGNFKKRKDLKRKRRARRGGRLEAGLESPGLEVGRN